MKMMSFFHSIPLHVCNFRNCLIRYNLGDDDDDDDDDDITLRYNLGEVEIHNTL